MNNQKKSVAFIEIIRELIENRKLIKTLSRNDFKAKFAGSFFGILWAFVQPIVTVLVYWFVFDKAINVGGQVTKAGLTAPYVVWLVAGMVPWFYFSEVVNLGSNTLIEYDYLVKKVVFKISTLPIVKIISSLFVHIFFIGFMVVLYIFYGYAPTLYMLQVFYYSFAMIILCIGIIYATSAIAVFFRDLTQIISIFMQVLMWMTPIMWNMQGMVDQGRISKPIEVLLKMNPMYYVVSGYRDAMLNNTWFWERGTMNLYFWGVTIVLFILGTTIFKKLQPHFADVL
ncbi:MAG: ABC transporter permease [Lachnospiraceae bacterium]|jgi:teichoic acid transport system permease protein|nr:ABC transporter permease [Lachnospiraceae bacterium]MCR5354655.1 ABC transporter permease [Lachnospiraceae bacterium]